MSQRHDTGQETCLDDEAYDNGAGQRKPMFYRFAYLLVRLYARLICRTNAVGREHIPDSGPFLIVSNHLSAVDPPVIVSLIPSRLGLTGMAAMAHRNDPFIGWLIDRSGAIWVRRGEADRNALRQALDVLSSGRPLGMAPEGTRSNTGALIEGKSGAAYLALKAAVPILPVVLTGTEDVVPALRRLRRTTVQARFAPTFTLPSRGDRRQGEHVRYCTELIMTRLASMLPQSYHGVYTGHPLIAYWEQLEENGTETRPG